MHFYYQVGMEGGGGVNCTNFAVTHHRGIGGKFVVVNWTFLCQTISHLERIFF